MLQCISLQLTIQLNTFFVQSSVILYNDFRDEVQQYFQIGGIKMFKKYLLLVSKLVALGSFLFAVFNANSTCVFIYHQPVLPDKVKKLRRIK